MKFEVLRLARVCRIVLNQYRKLGKAALTLENLDMTSHMDIPKGFTKLNHKEAKRSSESGLNFPNRHSREFKSSRSRKRDDE